MWSLTLKVLAEVQFFFFFLPDLFVFSSRLLEKKDALNFVESITFFLFPLVCFNVEMI